MELPGGVLDKSNSQFHKETERTVRVSGTRFIPKPYIVLLEGVQHIGYRSIVIQGARNPRMIAQKGPLLYIRFPAHMFRT